MGDIVCPMSGTEEVACARATAPMGVASMAMVATAGPFLGKMFLVVVVDWLDVRVTNTATSTTTIDMLCTIE